jgi:putative transposase
MNHSTYEAAGYDTDLNDAEWDLIEPLLYPAGAKRGRGRQREAHAARAAFDAIRYLLKAGCQWSLLPKDFPPKSTVHDALAAWTRQGIWPRINAVLREEVRVKTLKKTPRQALRSSTAKASKAGSSRPAAAAMTRAKRSKGANATR